MLRKIKVRIIILLILILTGIAITSGFYFHQINNLNKPNIDKADVAVVLTGGYKRIETGIQLLSEKKIKKLLISGVTGCVTASDFEHLYDKYAVNTDDVILGKIATDTISNATEAKLFIELNSLNDVIIITSDYHIPRVKLIFDNTIKEHNVIYYPITSLSSNSKTLTVISEIIKLMLMHLYIHIDSLLAYYQLFIQKHFL